jgi:hypothetical protein
MLPGGPLRKKQSKLTRISEKVSFPSLLSKRQRGYQSQRRSEYEFLKKTLLSPKWIYKNGSLDIYIYINKDQTSSGSGSIPPRATI